MSATTKAELVSSEDEPLILVDSNDRQLGYLNKAACHNGFGRLHRAFSVFIFNEDSEVLLQKRATGKRLWPSHWSNSCCSHPRRGESMQRAVRRRVDEELGLAGSALRDLRFVYRFEYHEKFQDLGSEHELCSVFLANTDREPIVNTLEIDEWAWIDPRELSDRLAQQTETHTPWLKREWAELLAKYADKLPIR